MKSPSAALLIFYTIIVHMKSVSSRVAPSSHENDCPHQCRCLPDFSFRASFICSTLTRWDWELTCQQITNNSQSSVIDLKILGNYSSISGKLMCLPKLQSLDLSKTSLMVSENMFHGLRVDSILNISSNEIRILAADAFLGLEHLNELDLSHNFISELKPEFLKGLSSLTVLRIGFNDLSVLSLESFSYTPSLRYLGLEYNRLQEFSSLYIPRSATLKSLNLRGNILQFISTDLNRTDLYLWRNVTSLDISGNPLDCSCALRNLYTLVPDLSNVLVNSPATICTSPDKWKGKGILNIDNSQLTCTVPNSMISFPSSSKDVLSTTSITLQCQAKGYPKPSIMWITPWKDKFFNGSRLLLHSHGLQPEADEKIHTYRQYKERMVFIVSSVHLTSNNDLIITKIRGSMSGNYTCLAFNIAGNSSIEINLLVSSAMKNVVMHSLFMGGYCASGFLIFGFIVGFIRMLVTLLKHKLYFIVPMFSKSPSAKPPEDNSTCHSFDVSMSRHDSEDRDSENSTPDSLLVCSGDLDRTESSEKCDDLGDGHIPGSWLSHGILDSFEEAKGRLRYGVGRKMERVRKNVQSIKESGSVYVQNIVDSSSSAANRMKAGMAFGVEAVKYHVQSIKELCGTGDMGTQTISMVSVETDVDSNQQKEVIRQITFV